MRTLNRPIKPFLFIALFLSGLLSVFAQTTPQNLVVNGSFESPVITAGGGNGIPDGWTPSGGPDNFVDILRSPFLPQMPAPQDGDQYVELDSRGNTSISQVLSTSAGTTYEISFYMSHRGDAYWTSPYSQIEVFWDGISLGATLQQSTVGWVRYSFRAVGTGGPVELRLTPIGYSDSTGEALDDVRVVAVIPVTVSANQGPWSQSLNPSYDYGDQSNGPPVVVDASSGLSITVGALIKVAVVGGGVSNGQPTYTQGDGYPDSEVSTYDGPICGRFPGYYQYIGPLTYTMQLIGTFAQDGVIVGKPFIVGHGPTTLPQVPEGANQLLLGFNDNCFSDNFGSLDIDIEVVTPGSRTFLVTFTGFLNTSPSTGCGLTLENGETAINCYPEGQLEHSQGMTTLLENVKNVLPGKGVISQAFTFYRNEHRCPYPLPPGACEPIDVLDHDSAEQWLRQQAFAESDRLIVAGHSYGGFRAWLFTSQIYRNFPGAKIDTLVLADPVDWTTCKRITYLTKACKQERDTPKPLPAGMLASNAFEVRQTIDRRIHGFRVDKVFGTANEKIVDIIHWEVDDSEPVQRVSLEQISPNSLNERPTDLRFTIGVPYKRVTLIYVPLTVTNIGQLVADHMAVKMTLGAKDSTTYEYPSYLLPGDRVDVALQFSSKYKPGSTVPLLLEFYSNGYLFKPVSTSVTIP